MPKRQTFVLVSFLVLVGASFGLSRLLSGGSDTTVVGRALLKASAARRFIGTITVAVAPQGHVASSADGLAPPATGYSYTARGHFAVAPGQALTGAWSVSLGSLREEVTEQPVMDMVVTEDGRLFVRAEEIPVGLAAPAGSQNLTEAWAISGGEWVEGRAADLWPVDEARSFDAAAKWNELVDAVLRGEVFAVAGRKPSEWVGGTPSWRFSLTPTVSGAMRVAIMVDEMRLGRRLTDQEAVALKAAVAASRPSVDVWVDKASGEMRRLDVSYMTAPPAGSEIGSAVAVSLNFSSWTAYEPVTPPEVE